MVDESPSSGGAAAEIAMQFLSDNSDNHINCGDRCYKMLYDVISTFKFLNYKLR